GGGSFTGFSPYSGQVSVLEGPDFSVVTPLITGLPVSNHDHGINGMTFDENGDLLIAVGGNTNAGIPAPNLGDLPESPLSAAILKARISDSDFNGTIQYLESTTSLVNNDQVYGGIVDVAPGIDVSVYSSGFRNPFDIVWTTQGKLYGTDNGPNSGYGAASTSATTQGPDPNNPDEINLLLEGLYYGHPNRNRGRYDDLENVYKGPSAPVIPGEYMPPLITLPPSSNGMDEYRSMAFNGQMRGNLLVQKWNGQLYSAKLSTEGSAIVDLDTITNGPSGLDVVTGPGGAILGIDYQDNTITVSLPNDVAAVAMTAYDIFPWRAPAVGGSSFVIGGKNFGSLADTSVTLGGQTAVLTSVSPTRIRGIIPAQASSTTELLDLVINSSGKISVIADAFQYLGNVV
ncbi:MAG: PQQ-dependent sugar dehydrogenase, partial [Coleofasciculus sp. S288]|nr:PQQ-dependent sugar dehydrogenase [Coleofasciculus sp. S288]